MTELGPSPLMRGDNNLSVEDARAAIAAALQPVRDVESIGLAEALGRILAHDVISPIDVPAHDNSAMDGYALTGSDLPRHGATCLTPAGTVFAGSPFAGRVTPGQCVRIMTGAVMPAGLDTVVPQELCQLLEDGRVRIAAGTISPGENRRLRGEDLTLGKPAVKAGRVLHPADIGLIASLGIPQVTVKRRLKVAVFSTGDELRNAGEALPPGCIYDSNRYTLLSALQRLGVETLDLGLVRDDPEALEATMRKAIAHADAVVTSGGVSVGDADFTRDLLARFGTVQFWKVAMRPGRPFAFGPLREGASASASASASAAAEGDPSKATWLFALPGNPVASLVTFHVFVREALLQLAGATPEPLATVFARCASGIRKRPGRSEFQRGRLQRDADGRWSVRLTGSQGAGILRSMSEANCLLVLGHDQGSVAPGADVECWPFDALL